MVWEGQKKLPECEVNNASTTADAVKKKAVMRYAERGRHFESDGVPIRLIGVHITANEPNTNIQTKCEANGEHA